MDVEKISDEALAKLNAIQAKRPNTVIQHLLAHGYITSDELKNIYGYDHPPRAARDVRELGIELITFKVDNGQGRKIAAYRFGSLEHIGETKSKSAGRTALDRVLKTRLIEKYGSRCFINNVSMRKENLQIDHRIPYEIGGETDDQDLDNYLLLSASANRQKSWACEHCPNWKEKSIEKCKKCFWAYPENHKHIACEEARILTITFHTDELQDYEKLMIASDGKPDSTVKSLIREFLKKLK
ncbi:MAG: hypothetical protein IJS08_16180 [Victivallales bacterium]|nr:hypothetical protein [Victivallales bacterium]